MEVHRGEVFYADLSPVVGSEQGGIRPAYAYQRAGRPLRPGQGQHYFD